MDPADVVLAAGHHGNTTKASARQPVPGGYYPEKLPRQPRCRLPIQLIAILPVTIADTFVSVKNELLAPTRFY